MKRSMLRIGKGLLVVYLGVIVLLIMLEQFLVYPVPSKEDSTWAAETFNAEDVHFESKDGTRLHGWYLEHPNPRAHLLFCHGNGEHVGYLGDWLVALSNRLHVSIFAFDYRGYGKSEGKPFEQGVLEDGEAAQQWLASRAAIHPNEIVLYGRSLGGGVAVHLAGKNGARALVAERTFHSMVEIGARQYPWAPIRWLMRNRYPSDERITNYNGPLLQMHGTTDRMVPLESAKTLFAACPSQQKEFFEVAGMGHDDFAPQEFFERFEQLINSLPRLMPSQRHDVNRP
jgi:fermentation-respiration switch protein FrsA (DUF1100 family)